MLISKFVSVRPFLYHLTAGINLYSIEARRCLESAATILEREGNGTAVRKRRTGMVTSESGILLRDQQPLHLGHCDLDPGWEFEDLLEYLNRHVFFWPGTDSCPVEAGLNHFRRYSSEDVVVLRFATDDLFKANTRNPPRFSRVNSGAPRTSGGKRSPRGPRTFLPAEEFDGNPGDVVEVVFPGYANIPSEYSVLNPEQWRLPGTVHFDGV